ncbi:hypothetical protein ABEB36_015439 [Hypothenemus hampei]|uniref:Uncharacterized protein n=1 Tax=Hypothenemus hampei TaxID=57062 RepID=A0ABD1E148_HYPHA
MELLFRYLVRKQLFPVKRHQFGPLSRKSVKLRRNYVLQKNMNKFPDLECDLIEHPHYSTDLALSDYYISKLEKSLRGNFDPM